MNPYETAKLLNEYLLFHYGTEQEILDGVPGPHEALDFAARVVSQLLKTPCGPRALDVGCAVGRSSFELTRHCESVLGIDYSRAFVQAATTVKDRGELPFSRVIEGELRAESIARPPAGIHRNRAEFATGDATALDESLENFDVVLAANLICRLPEPRKFLDRLPSLVRSGGQLLLATPFTWLEEYTPKENWLGGVEGRRSFDTLRNLLAPTFELEMTCDLPFLIREHGRKFQYGVSLGSRWIRR